MSLHSSDAVSIAAKDIVRLFNTTDSVVDMNGVKAIYISFPDLSARLRLEVLVNDQLNVQYGKIWRGVSLKWSVAMAKQIKGNKL